MTLCSHKKITEELEQVNAELVNMQERKSHLQAQVTEMHTELSSRSEKTSELDKVKQDLQNQFASLQVAYFLFLNLARHKMNRK